MSPSPRIAVACLVVAAAVAGVGGAVGTDGPQPVALSNAAATETRQAVTIETFAYAGDGAVAESADPLTLWASDTHRFTVDLRASTSVERASVCIVATGTGGPAARLACEPVAVPVDGATSVTIEVGRWPANRTGEGQVAARVENHTGGDVLDRITVPVLVVDRSGDRDLDGLPNEREAALGTDLAGNDSDADGLADPVEVRTYGTEPTAVDSDADGLADGAEVFDHRTAPADPDTDGDGLSDGSEVSDLHSSPLREDTDGDGLTDGEELHTYRTNATVRDTDGDGLTDGSEVSEHDSNPTAGDTDGDGLADGREVWTLSTSPTSEDSDGDRLSDGTEVSDSRTDPTDDDTDGDGLADGVEVRDHGTSPNAPDTDSDGLTDGREVDRGLDPTAPTTGVDRGVVGTLSRHVLPVAGLALLVVLGASVAAAVADTRSTADDDSPGQSDDDTDGDGPDDPGSGPAAERTGEGSDTGEDGTEGHGSGAGAGVGVGAGNDASGDGSVVLTNEERVLVLLDEHGGRMRQSDMVDAADWSKATVSRVLSEMEADGEVTRVDIGKGNLVARPGEEPDGSSPPFSE